MWPWDKLFLYNLRLQSATKVYNAICKDGVNVTAQINIRFQLLHNYVAVLHKFIGPQYLEIGRRPGNRQPAREVISQYTAQEVYTSREQIQQKIRDKAQKSLGVHLNNLVQPEAMEQPDPKHYNDFLQSSIQILDTLVLSIELPPGDRRRHQSADRAVLHDPGIQIPCRARSRRIEAQADRGQRHRRVPATVSQGISDSYLRWRGIEATLALAQSKNSKVVIIGSGKDGLPIILGNVDNPPAAAGAAKPAENDTSSSDSTSEATSPEKTPQEATAPPGTGAPGQTNAGTPAGTPPAGGATVAQPSGGPLDLSRLKALLPWLAEELGSSKSATTSPGPSAAPKQ